MQPHLVPLSPAARGPEGICPHARAGQRRVQDGRDAQTSLLPPGEDTHTLPQPQPQAGAGLSAQPPHARCDLAEPLRSSPCFSPLTCPSHGFPHRQQKGGAPPTAGRTGEPPSRLKCIAGLAEITLLEVFPGGSAGRGGRGVLPWAQGEREGSRGGRAGAALEPAGTAVSRQRL